MASSFLTAQAYPDDTTPGQASNLKLTHYRAREEMIEWIGGGHVKAYVWELLRPGPEVRVVKATPPYLRSLANDEPTDNLLDLPEF